MEPVEYETTDMKFASFLVVRSGSPSGVLRSGRKASWTFQIDPVLLAQLEAEWPASEEHRLFSVHSALKGQIRGPKRVSAPKARSRSSTIEVV